MSEICVRGVCVRVADARDAHSVDGPRRRACVRTADAVQSTSHALCQFLLSRRAEKVELGLFVYVESFGCCELSATALHADCT